MWIHCMTKVTPSSCNYFLLSLLARDVGVRSLKFITLGNSKNNRNAFQRNFNILKLTKVKIFEFLKCFNSVFFIFSETTMHLSWISLCRYHDLFFYYVVLHERAWPPPTPDVTTTAVEGFSLRIRWECDCFPNGIFDKAAKERTCFVGFSWLYSKNRFVADSFIIERFKLAFSSSFFK